MEQKQYNNLKPHIIIALFDNFLQKCCTDLFGGKKGRKIYFYKLLKDTINIENGKEITRITIKKFLDILEQNEILELLEYGNGNNIYKVNKGKLENFYQSYEFFRQSERISGYFRILPI